MSREYFARVAGQWDELRAGFFSTAVRDKALALARVEPGLVAVDLGAGTGFVTEALLDAGLSVFAVDESPEMLARLTAKFGANPRLAVLPGTAARLPLPSGSADFVFANMFLHHADDPAGAVAEMARVLRPSGRLVITDLDRHAHAFLLTEHHDRWPGFERGLVRQWLLDAGLERAAVDCAGENCCADACDGSDRAQISIFAAHGRKPLLAIRPEDADPEAVGLLARSLWQAQPPLLCAESVLLGVARGLGVRSPLVPRVATGFCSGLSRSCGPCGVFSGGVMALGLALGRDSGQDELDETYGPVCAFREFFLAHAGALGCRELTGFDLGSAEGLAAYRERGLKASLCGPLIEAAAAQVVRILAEV